MIRGTMALAAAGERRFGRAEQAHEARFPRFVALILDSIFVSLLGGIATAVYGEAQVTGTWNPNGFSSWSVQTAIPAIWTGAIWLAYYTVCEAMFSATPGKALNGLCVVSEDDRPLTVPSIFFRNLLRLIDVLPGLYFIGGVLVLTSGHSQRLGDLAGHTTVVLRRYAVEPRTTRSSGRRAGLALIASGLIALTFSAGFGYFGRPPRDIHTLFQEHQFLDPAVTGYSLGAPAWSLGRVRYPVAASEPGKSCSGYIELQWYGIMGWQPSSGQLDCFLS